MLGLNEMLDKLENTLRLCGHYVLLRREDDDVLREVLHYEMAGLRKRGQLKGELKRQVEEEIDKIRGFIKVWSRRAFRFGTWQSLCKT